VLRAEKEFEMSELHHVRAGDVDPEPVHWLWEKRIPRRGVTVIAGPKGVSKTALACEFVARATSGDWGEPTTALYASREDDVAETLRPRIEAAGAPLDRVFFPDDDLNVDALRFPRDTPVLTRYLNRYRHGLVVFDSLEAFIPAFTQPEAAGDAMTRLTAVARRFDTAILFVHHLNKSGRTVDAAVGGAGSIVRVARAVYLYGEEPQPEVDFLLRALRGANDEDDEADPREMRVLANVKINAARPPDSLLYQVTDVEIPSAESIVRVVYIGESDYTADDILRNFRRPRRDDNVEGTMVEQGITFLVNFLIDGPQLTTTVNAAAREAGFSTTTIERARARTKIVAYQEQRQWWLKLPDWTAELDGGTDFLRGD
jgi:KaiC/GvpD/RAD55 family RecA-like ATPase